MRLSGPACTEARDGALKKPLLQMGKKRRSSEGAMKQTPLFARPLNWLPCSRCVVCGSAGFPGEFSSILSFLKRPTREKDTAQNSLLKHPLFPIVDMYNKTAVGSRDLGAIRTLRPKPANDTRLAWEKGAAALKKN